MKSLIHDAFTAGDTCPTSVTQAQVLDAWADFFGEHERANLTPAQLAARGDEVAEQLIAFRASHGFRPLPAEFTRYEQDALGPRAIPLSDYFTLVGAQLRSLGARVVTAVRATADDGTPLRSTQWASFKRAATTAVEKRTGDNPVARVLLLRALENLTLAPPGDLQGLVIAFADLKDPGLSGQAAGQDDLVIIDIGPERRPGAAGAANDAQYRYRIEGAPGEIALHELEHIRSGRICGYPGALEDQVFKALVPGFPFGEDAYAAFQHDPAYRGWTYLGTGTGDRVGVVRDYGARSVEEAQAVLLGELQSSPRYGSTLYDERSRADLTREDRSGLEAQVALWMARIGKASPDSYEYFRLLAVCARVRVAIGAALLPLELEAANFVQPRQIYTSTDPRALKLRADVLDQLKQAHDRVSVAMTGRPEDPTMPLMEAQW